ncbi:carbohydrate ABC transporter permease [Domibacillus robiginosus]|uniref:carbohydrate ABC transporter permease n=1 Tax=Domibacillus robiginosus TaxID=1071054 RepID=UPI00067DA159|nr:sugar ABC transporter permease [Domibacillus robiginosus]
MENTAGKLKSEIHSKRAAKKSNKQITPRPLVYVSVGFLALVTQVPFVLTLYYSTLNWNLQYPKRGKEFVGLANYKALFTNTEFLQAFIVTLKLTVLILILSLVLGLALAILLHRKFPGKGIVRSMLFAPFLVMTTVTTLVWKNMILDPSYGFLAALFKLFGMTPIDVIGNYPTLTIVLVATWTWTPFMMLILHAALESLPEEMMEAAAIDGASRMYTFIYIVLPFLKQYIFICVLLGAIMILPLFGEIALITAGGPGQTTTNLSYFVYEEAFQGYSIGSASASGVVASLVTLVIGTVLIRIFNKKGEEA